MGPTPRTTSTSGQAAQVPTYRLKLNDYLQQWRRREKPRWAASSSGRQERPQWTVTCYLSDIAYGTGHGPTKSEAKERAAKETLDILYGRPVAGWSSDYYKWAGAGGTATATGTEGADARAYGNVTTAYASPGPTYIATPGTPAAGLQALPSTSASPSQYTYPSQYQTYHYQPYYYPQQAPQQQAYYVYSTSDQYYRR